MPTLLEQFAERAAAAGASPLPAATEALARERLVDFAGVTTLGHAASHTVHLLRHRFGGAAGAATLPGGGSADPATAALLNATAAHALEFDDGHAYVGMHAMSVVIPAALAAAEVAGADYGRLLSAVVSGYEAGYRLAAALSPWHIKRGFHATSTLGPIAAATAAATALGLDRRQVVAAVGIAALTGAGLSHVLSEAYECKPYQVGRAARSGVEAALLAADGLAGPTTVLEGHNGLLRAMAARHRRSVLTDPAECPLIHHTYTKLYPCCRYMHVPIDLFKTLAPPAEAIAAMRVETYRRAADEVGGGWPADPDAARFRLRFALAVAAARGDVTLADFNPQQIDNPDLRALGARVTVVRSPKWESRYPKERGATLRVQLTDGRELVAEGCRLHGTPDAPVTHADLQAKLRLCLSAAGQGGSTGSVWKAILASPLTTHVRTLAAALGG